MNQNDATLVARVLEGEKTAFGCLVDRHRLAAVRLARRLCGSAADVEDIVQEALLQAFLNLEALQNPDSFGSWLLGIITNLCKTRLRIRRTPSFVEDWDGGRIPLSFTWADTAPSSEMIYEARELHQIVCNRTPGGVRLSSVWFSDRQHFKLCQSNHRQRGLVQKTGPRTPPAVRGLVQALLQRLVAVEARLNQTARNSSNPPSSDPPSVKRRPAKEPSGRKSGGQLGHEGHGRKLKPESKVDQIIEVRPESCGQCGTLLLGEDPEPERHQVTELPRITPIVTEYRRHRLRCVACGTSTQAAWPATMPTGSFGPRVQATVGYLMGRIGASQREVQEILATLGQTDVSVGSIGAVAQAVSAALATPVAEAATYVQRQPVRNADETSWREKTKRVWLWISVTPVVTIFRLLKTRGAAGAKELLGEEVWGVSGQTGTLAIIGLIRANANSVGPI